MCQFCFLIQSQSGGLGLWEESLDSKVQCSQEYWRELFSFGVTPLITTLHTRNTRYPILLCRDEISEGTFAEIWRPFKFQPGILSRIHPLNDSFRNGTTPAMINKFRIYVKRESLISRPASHGHLIPDQMAPCIERWLYWSERTLGYPPVTLTMQASPLPLNGVSVDLDEVDLARMGYKQELRWVVSSFPKSSLTSLIVVRRDLGLLQVLPFRFRILRLTRWFFLEFRGTLYAVLCVERLIVWTDLFFNYLNYHWYTFVIFIWLGG